MWGGGANASTFKFVGKGVQHRTLEASDQHTQISDFSLQICLCFFIPNKALSLMTPVPNQLPQTENHFLYHLI